MADLNDMMVFRSVVDQGSFTAAANHMGLPKSNISRKVSRLEEQLGTRLLERSTRALHLTEVGRIYYEHCQRIAEEVSSAEQSIESHSSEPRGWIKFCSSVTLGQALISPHLPVFAKRYPEVHLNMTLTNRRVDIIEEGFDITIRAGESPDSNLVSKKLYSAKLNLYTSPEYLQTRSHLPINKPDDLLHHACLFMNAGGDKAKWKLSDKNSAIDLDFKPSHLSNDFGSIRHMLLAGMGISLLPEYLCSVDLEQHRLVRVLDNWSASSVNIYAIYPSRKGVAPKLRAFLNYFGENL